jgi:hypothetical protein
MTMIPICLLLFTYEVESFHSGRCWDRTSGLCRVKATKVYLMRLNIYSNDQND